MRLTCWMRFAKANIANDAPSTGSFAQERERFNALLSQLQDRLKKLHSRNQAVDLVMTRMQNGLIAVDADLRVILVTTVAKELLGIKGNAEGLPIVDASKDVRLDQLFSDAMRHADGIYTNEVAARMPGGRGHRPLRLYVSVMRRKAKWWALWLWWRILQSCSMLDRCERILPRCFARVKNPAYLHQRVCGNVDERRDRKAGDGAKIFAHHYAGGGSPHAIDQRHFVDF